MELQGRHFVLGLTDGIACYRSAELVQLLTKAGAAIQVVMTRAATHFTTLVTMQALSGRPIFTSRWDGRIDNNVPHIDLSREADAIVIAPASTDLMAKLTHDMADDLFSTLYVAHDCPLLVAPAVSRQVRTAPATRHNAAQLRADDVTLFGPDAGDRACDEVGDGRMLESEDIVEQLIGFFQPKLLHGHRVLLTTGPTFKPISPVRGITSLSNSKTDFALTRAASQVGAEATLVAGPCHQDTPAGVLHIDVQATQQVHDAVMHGLDTAKNDIFIAVAAVADQRVAQVTEHKLKKQSDADVPSLTFTQNPDILAAVAHRPSAPFCVGFAAETERLEGFDGTKRQRKGIPLLVGNLGHRTFDHGDNEIAPFDAKRITRLPYADELTFARQIVTAIADRVHGAQP